MLMTSSTKNFKTASYKVKTAEKRTSSSNNVKTASTNSSSSNKTNTIGSSIKQNQTKNSSKPTVKQVWKVKQPQTPDPKVSQTHVLKKFSYFNAEGTPKSTMAWVLKRN